MINPELKEGDKVVLLNMDGETSIGYGEKGEVLRISIVFGHKQYKVKWENGSTLDLLEDADRWMKEDDFLQLKNKKRIKESYTIKKRDILSSRRIK